MKGIGEVSLQKLNQAGIFTKFDLINFLPKNYRSIDFVENIEDVVPGEVTVRARAKNIKLKRTNRFLTILTAELEDDTSKILAVWFNQPYRQKQIEKGEFYFSGKYEFSAGKYQLMNPSVQQVAEKNDNLSENRIQPIYSQIRGLKTSFFTKTIESLKNDILVLNETLPKVIVEKMNLMERSEGIFELHFPSSLENIQKAKWREQIEEYFIAGLASAINGLKNNRQKANKIELNIDLLKQYIDHMPFKLTDDQKKAIWKIAQNINKNHPMNLLLQGDVGSGKTVVAEITSLLVAKSGFQSAFMAPTEILATQHYQKISKNLAKNNIKVKLLTSSIKGKKREQIYADLKTGKIDLLIGTHALIQDEVVFKNLAFVVIDEQHRFGVVQRDKLIKKGNGISPHLLSMTATPIPRSLALTLKNELEVTSIHQKPNGRKPIKTEIFTERNKSLVYENVKSQLEIGHQAYVVCGLIDEDEDEQVQSVKNVYKRLSTKDLKDYRLAILHGKMKPDEKAEIMDKFAKHEIDVLVATTVVEVGVDVANATVIVIETANRYGLSQLHQLRGRVGRNNLDNFCYLISENDKASERLQAIAKSEDGFYLSELDLKMRGMGSLYGSAQHGWFNLEENIAAIKQANENVKYYLEYLDNNNLDLNTELDQLPELKSRIEQFDKLTLLN